jgi:hypothetical protein
MSPRRKGREIPEKKEEEEPQTEDMDLDDEDSIPDVDDEDEDDLDDVEAMGEDTSKLSPDDIKEKRRQYRIERYKKRFVNISKEGGLELEEIESEIDEKGETKITKDGVLLGGNAFYCTYKRRLL